MEIIAANVKVIVFDRSHRYVCSHGLWLALHLFSSPACHLDRFELRTYAFGADGSRIYSIGLCPGPDEPFIFLVEEPSQARMSPLVRDGNDVDVGSRPYRRNRHVHDCQRVWRRPGWRGASAEHPAGTKVRLCGTAVLLCKRPQETRTDDQTA